MNAGERWTDEAVRLESERWIHVPSEGVRIEDERRLLVHLPRRWGRSRVWRSSVPDEEHAEELIRETIGAVRDFGGATLALAKTNVVTSGPTLERAGFRVVATERRHALEVR